MAYNPNLPSAHAPIVSQELRDQLNALKALIDAQAAQISTLSQQLVSRPTLDDVNAAIAANSAANSDTVFYMQLVPSDPPTQSEVQAIIDRLNELITALNRQL
jgi:hypothetical protein